MFFVETNSSSFWSCAHFASFVFAVLVHNVQRHRPVPAIKQFVHNHVYHPKGKALQQMCTYFSRSKFLFRLGFLCVFFVVVFCDFCSLLLSLLFRVSTIHVHCKTFFSFNKFCGIQLLHLSSGWPFFIPKLLSDIRICFFWFFLF